MLLDLGLLLSGHGRIAVLLAGELQLVQVQRSLLVVERQLVAALEGLDGLAAVGLLGFQRNHEALTDDVLFACHDVNLLDA